MAGIYNSGGALDDLAAQKNLHMQLKAGRAQLFPLRWKDSTDISTRSAFSNAKGNPKAVKFGILSQLP